MGRPKKDKSEEIPQVNPDNTDVAFAAPSGIPINRDNIKVEITDEERERFYKCFLSDNRFHDEHPLFDGKVKVELKSITVEENNDIWRQINYDLQNGEIANNNTEAYLLLINIYRLAMAIESIDGFKFDASDITKDTFVVDKEKPHITYVKAKADKFKNWDTFKLSAFVRVFNEFERKVFLLEKEVANPNFWKATV